MSKPGLLLICLVFASLIIPTLATVRLAEKQRLSLAFILGAIAYAAGPLVSALLDLPSGAVIVWSMALLGILLASCLHLNLYKKSLGQAPCIESEGR